MYEIKILEPRESKGSEDFGLFVTIHPDYIKIIKYIEQRECFDTVAGKIRGNDGYTYFFAFTSTDNSRVSIVPYERLPSGRPLYTSHGLSGVANALAKAFGGDVEYVNTRYAPNTMPSAIVNVGTPITYESAISGVEELKKTCNVDTVYLFYKGTREQIEKLAKSFVNLLETDEAVIE